LPIPHRIAATLAAAAAVPLLSGCLVSSKSASTQSRTYVGESSFEQIKPGETTDEWLLAVLGTPTSQSCLGDGGEVWKWSHTKTTSSSGTVLFLFGGSSSHVKTGSACVELRDGVVTRKWRD